MCHMHVVCVRYLAQNPNCVMKDDCGGGDWIWDVSRMDFSISEGLISGKEGFLACRAFQ